MKTTIRITIALAALLAQTSQAAVIGQGTTPPGAAFAGACAGLNTNVLGAPGDAFNLGISTAQLSCQTNTSGIGGTAAAGQSAQGLSNNRAYSNNATTSASPGFIHLNANNSGTVSSNFPGGAGNAGWNDSIIWQGPSGIWVYQLMLDATMDSFGLGAYGTVEVGVYNNNNVIQGNAYAYWHANNPDRIGPVGSVWDFEMLVLQTHDSGPNAPLTLQHLSVSQIIQFAIPVTNGAVLNFGTYAALVAGEDSSSGGGWPDNQTNLDVQHTIKYAGPGYVVLPGGGIDANLTFGPSASGFDYSQPAASPASGIPEPGTVWLALAGVVAIMGKKMRARR